VKPRGSRASVTGLSLAFAVTLAAVSARADGPSAEVVAVLASHDSRLADEIRRALPSTAHIVANVLESQVVIEAIEDTQKTTVEASTAFGQVRELELHCKLRYRVLDPNGTELLPLADIERFRDMTYDEKDALAKDTEQKALYRDTSHVPCAIAARTSWAARASSSMRITGTSTEEFSGDITLTFVGSAGVASDEVAGRFSRSAGPSDPISRSPTAR